MSNALVAILVIVGAVMLLLGMIGGYIAYTAPLAAEIFLVYISVAFIGVIVVLAGFAMAMGKEGK